MNVTTRLFLNVDFIRLILQVFEQDSDHFAPPRYKYLLSAFKAMPNPCCTLIIHCDFLIILTELGFSPVFESSICSFLSFVTYSAQP